MENLQFLQEIYKRITELRNKKVRMKEMAERCGIAPSVFSAIYSTVIPYYLKNREKGMEEEAALDDALIWVNNVSKKKLLGSIRQLMETLADIKPIPPATKVKEDRQNPFLPAIARAMAESCKTIRNYQGTYMSYSVSSAKKAMKAEPYLLAPAETGDYVEVVHNSVYGSTHHGFALMNGLNHLYLEFNELQSPQLALYNICLKLPMYDHPPFLRGVYTCFDYNYNPIARRLVLVKLSDSTDRDEFQKLKGRLLTEDELTDREKTYFEYTCGKEDVIRLAGINRPQMTDDDLLEEKRTLGSL